MSDKKHQPLKNIIQFNSKIWNKEVTIDELDSSTDENSICFSEVASYMKDYVKLVVQYTLDVAANKGRAIRIFQCGDEDQATGATIIKSSILSLEEEITKQLGL